MSPLADWFGVSVVELRRQLVLALLFGEALPLAAVLYLVAGFIWPGTVAGGPGWKVVLIVLLGGVALLMVAGALIVAGVIGRISTLSRTLQAVNLPEVEVPGDDELTGLARRLNALLKQHREKEMQVQRLEYAVRRLREDGSGQASRAGDVRPGHVRPYVGKAVFDLVLELELARASRYHRNFSLAAVWFHPTDDAVSEDVRDKAVKWTVSSQHEYLRESDIGYRRSDEDVLALLPETDERQAVKFAHRLCSSVEAHPFVSGGRIGGVRVRAYCGVATYPVDAKEADRLIEIATKRLGQARETGSSVVGSV
jgi:diguanylate cyclase (GGDEF)-like protein